MTVHMRRLPMLRAMTWGKVLNALAALRMMGKEFEFELAGLVEEEEEEEEVLVLVLVVRGRRFKEWIT